MTRVEIEEAAADCDLGRVVGPLDSLLDEEWETLHRFVEWASRDLRADRDRLAAEVEALLKELRRSVNALDMLTDRIDGTGLSDADEFLSALDAIDLGRAAMAAIDAAKASAA